MPEKEKLNLGQILKERRCDLKYTQSEISELAELNKALYQKYEYNICRPNLENTLKICYYLQLSLDKITDEYMENKKNKDFSIPKIKRDVKYSTFIKNNFHYKQRKGDGDSIK